MYTLIICSKILLHRAVIILAKYCFIILILFRILLLLYTLIYFRKILFPYILIICRKCCFTINS